MNDERSEEKKIVLKREIYYPFIPISDRKWDEKEKELPSIPGFTKGSEYPIYEERLLKGASISQGPYGFVYVTKDDEGKSRTVPCFYFTAKDRSDYSFIEDTHPEWLRDQPHLNSNIRDYWDRLNNENCLAWSGLPEAMLNFQAMLKEVEDTKYLSGVNTTSNEILDRVLKVEKQLAAIGSAIASLKDVAVRITSETKER